MLYSTFLFGVIAAEVKACNLKGDCKDGEQCLKNSCVLSDSSWMSTEEKTTQLTEQQKKVNEDTDMLINGQLVSKRTPWLEAYLSHFGFAPQSDCTGQTSDSCPTGFRASCYENEKGECERKWVPNGDEKCSALTGPSQYGEAENEVQKTTVDETYCNEYFCTRNEEKNGSFCRDVKETDREARRGEIQKLREEYLEKTDAETNVEEALL